MTAEAYTKLLHLARNRKNWSAKLFELYRAACIERTPCIFNELRKTLPEKDYEEFDLEYCEFFRSGQKEVTEYIKRERREEDWRAKKRSLLLQKRRLLLKK